MTSAFEIPSRPTSKRNVYELLSVAGYDVTDWHTTADNKKVENPNTNTGRNTAWSFLGKPNDPIVLCIWYSHINWTSSPPEYVGNESKHQAKLEAIQASLNVKSSQLTSKISESRKLHRTIFEAHKSGRPVKLILVDGNEVGIEDAHLKASTVSARSLDPGTWYVHEMDGMSGHFKVVRGVKKNEISEDESEIDLINNELMTLISTMSETEREAIIKARVGQGIFKDRLLKRWGGCSVTDCNNSSFLIASHIIPWSQCADPNDRLNVANGLLLTPNLDKLFDRGFITFNEKFRIVVSPLLSREHALVMGVTSSMQLKISAFTDTLPYLKWHRENVFNKHQCSQ